MLEVKNLYREYKPKKGSAVVALDHVSVKFPDKGLVFILGKSGSGKSTLLNVMGGLDKADDGDIIIKGKSSKDFKQGDFDSYRNTYLGFIFQEYNILDEFNVGQNIALALELQGKKATTEKINEILEEVDLKGYGSRKTNELSGGQKQRVAIARALVKDPDIIFGDEPTGALDSKTGIAVFDTLKKLSEKKLVVVVSHDREFAELYGDRVIELADGKIISDIEKIKVAGEKVNSNSGITVIDNSVLRVDKDYELTDEDMMVIKKYLNEKRNQERLISLDDSVNAPFKRITRIDELGNKESFKKTDEEAIINKKEEFKSIKSRLSLRKCFRIGGSSLKNKPFRLIITILLSITAFAMFGLSDTMGSYDKIDSTTKSIVDYGGDSIAMSKEYFYKYDEDREYFNTQDLKSNDADIALLKEKYGIDFKGVYKIGYGTMDFANYFKKSRTNYYAPDATYASGLYVSSANEVTNDLGFAMTGNYPEKENEIAITKFMYDSFKKYGYRNPYDETDSLEPSDVTESLIIGKSLRLYTNNGDKKLIITAIIDTRFDSSRYSVLENENNNIVSYMQYEGFNSDYGYGYHGLFFTNDETARTMVSKNIDNINIKYNYLYGDNYFNSVSVDKNEQAGYVKYKTGTTKLENKQIGLSLDALYYYDLSHINCNQFNLKYLYYIDNEYYIDSQPVNKVSDAINYLYNDENLKSIYEIEKKDPTHKEPDLDYTSFSNYYMSLVNKIFTQDVIDNVINYIGGLSITLSYWNSIGSYDTKYVLNDDYCSLNALVLKRNNAMYFGEDFVKSLNVDDGYYSFLIAKNNIDDEKLLEIVKETYVDPINGLIHYRIQNGVMPAYNNINSLIEDLSQVFLYIGIGFAVFASLMIFNFITISISYKKREIGILRAVGARSRDVFNIFFAESFIIAMIAFAFAISITFVVSIVINNTLANEYSLLITLLNPGVRQILLVLGVSLGVAFISTLLPVYKIAMKRPIDAIRDR